MLRIRMHSFVYVVLIHVHEEGDISLLINTTIANIGESSIELVLMLVVISDSCFYSSFRYINIITTLI